MIAILTDFGDSEYAGVMKGVICTMCAEARIIDITNNVPSHNIREGAWILFISYRYFPRGTIFLCVVDPGVGSSRNAIAVKTKNYFFVGPDNGLMYPAMKSDGIIDARKLDTNGASKTFHGRDVFAKSAGFIEGRKQFELLGNRIEIMERFAFYRKGREGEVVRIDSFGNIITNLEHIGKKRYNVTAGKKLKAELDFFENYESSGKGLFLVEGSSGTLEIARKNSGAAEILRLKIGERITIL